MAEAQTASEGGGEYEGFEHQEEAVQYSSGSATGAPLGSDSSGPKELTSAPLKGSHGTEANTIAGTHREDLSSSVSSDNRENLTPTPEGGLSNFPGRTEDGVDINSRAKEEAARVQLSTSKDLSGGGNRSGQYTE